MEKSIGRGRRIRRPTTIKASDEPSPSIGKAGDSKQPARTKPKGFALAALFDCIRALRSILIWPKVSYQSDLENADIQHLTENHLRQMEQVIHHKILVNNDLEDTEL